MDGIRYTRIVLPQQQGLEFSDNWIRNRRWDVYSPGNIAALIRKADADFSKV
jgi:hypothetical protein